MSFRTIDVSVGPLCVGTTCVPGQTRYTCDDRFSLCRTEMTLKGGIGYVVHKGSTRVFFFNQDDDRRPKKCPIFSRRKNVTVLRSRVVQLPRPTLTEGLSFLTLFSSSHVPRTQAKPLLSEVKSVQQLSSSVNRNHPRWDKASPVRGGLGPNTTKMLAQQNNEAMFPNS